MNFKLMEKLMTMNENKLKNFLIYFLSQQGYIKIIKKQNFILAKGDIPICLIAHLDTVNESIYNRTPEMCLYDEKKDIFHVVSGGTLDDRLGVFSIIQILLKGYKPNIIFTSGEEVGGVGAYELIECYPKSPFDINFIIELDRQGFNDAVYYSCNNKQFEQYINSFGFITRIGTFTDCLIIGKKWNIASVNLSCGYINEHTIYEYAHLEWTLATILKVEKILDDWTGINNLPFTKLKYNIKKKEEKSCLEKQKIYQVENSIDSL